MNAVDLDNVVPNLHLLFLRCPRIVQRHWASIGFQPANVDQAGIRDVKGHTVRLFNVGPQDANAELRFRHAWQPRRDTAFAITTFNIPLCGLRGRADPIRLAELREDFHLHHRILVMNGFHSLDLICGSEATNWL
eukprot:CAMPEP_0115244438 /NCGR_PEP_ID=MMETSP0270-20121206/39985_1 /TAXON_ID=71861 /ORGANISM="Scrippsiella trochoidea, Strain CCMP3099" /LENGTH=134 /DNA_ID=CAMNT_0002659569 /DNA_START=483 /DNA_END=887 /DNA_ORIENTATION=+